MKMTLAQARLSAAIARSGMPDTEIAAVLGVNQSTAWRLRHGKIAKTASHQRKLDDYLGRAASDQVDDLSELTAIAQTSPALRETLAALRRLLHENA